MRSIRLIDLLNRILTGERHMKNTTVLPDGSAFFTASLPLPANHWLTAPAVPGWDSERDTAPDTPQPFLNHAEHRDRVVAAMRYAIRGATMRTRKRF